MTISYVEGPRGLRGPVGPRGTKGTVGPAGPRGLQGDRGATGLQGPAGATGAQGPTGATGPQGPAGATGPIGLQGPQGPQGAQGLQGIQGVPGPQGPQGIPGNNGAAGLQGPAGATGAQGMQGEVGPQGPQGIPGNDGAVGPQGPKGDTGAQGTSVVLQGTLALIADLDTVENPQQGDAWVVTESNGGDLYFRTSSGTWDNIGRIVGPAGAAGAQGVKGDKGDQGEPGIQGPQGDQGVQGVQGATGETGPAGPQGMQGEVGPQGIQGEQGPAGATGPQGPAGATGPQGPAGAKGDTGAQGPQGERAEEDRLVNGAAEVVLNSDGTLTTPAGLSISKQFDGNAVHIGSSIQSDFNKNLRLQAIGTGSGSLAWQNFEGDVNFVTLNYNQSKNILITTGNAVGEGVTHNWLFASNGNIQLPPGGDIVDIAGNSVLGGGSSPTNEITNTDGFSTYSVSVSNNGVVTMNTARGSLEFGAQPEEGAPTHFHIMRPAGQEGSSDLYFGDDYNYVKLPSSSYSQQGVEIGSSLNEGAVSVWRFGTDGDLVLPTGKTIRDISGTDLLAGSDTGGDPAYKGFKASYGRMWGNNDDPSGPINKIVIYKDTVTPSSTIDASTSNDTFTVTGLTGSDVVAMLVVIGDEVNQTTTAELKTFAESIIDNVILDEGVEGDINSINSMRTAFYDNFNTFSATLTDLKTNFEFFSVNNQFNISPQFDTGKGASFSGISYNMSDDTLGLGSWGQNAGTHQVGDIFVIPGNTIQDANGNFLLTPDNDVTVTVTVAPDGYIGTAVLTGTLPRPQQVWPSNYINDGGDDEYDTGNYITTNLESNISYNNGDVVSSSNAFGGGDYVVTYQNSIFGVFAVNSAIDSIATQGGSGFDGNGQADTGSLYGAVNSGVNIGDFVFNGSTMTSPEDDLYIKAVDDLWLDALEDDVHIRANDDVRIKVGFDFDADSAQREWRFDTNGSIYFPDGSQQSTAYTGNNNSFSGNFYDLTNRPNGNTAVHDLIGGASSGDDGKYLKQTSIGVSEWADLPTNSYTPADATSWAPPAPTTISEALDRLAAKLAEISIQTNIQKP
jgi:hypothetical protein